MISRPVPWRAVVVGLAVGVAGCRTQAPPASPAEPSPPATTTPSEPVVESQPATASAPATATAPVGLDDQQKGWLRIEKLQPDVEGGWATGDFDEKRNRISLVTQNVVEFSVDRRELPIRWDRRVLLRINAQSMELARKDRPKIRFRQSPSGAWDIVSD